MNKKKLSLVLLLCVAHITGFAQMEVDASGNAGIGALPDSKAKLLLSNISASYDTLFGLHTTTEKTFNCNYGPVSCRPQAGGY